MSKCCTIQPNVGRTLTSLRLTVNSRTISSASQNVLKLILKSPRFVSFGTYLTQYGCQIWQACCDYDLTGEICRGREFADMLTYPYNCQHYVTCLSERSPVVQSCSAGLCYDQENGICDIKLNTGLKLNTYSTSFIIFLPLLCLRTKIFDFINYQKCKEKLSTKAVTIYLIVVT